MADLSVLEVRLHGRPIGTLTRYGGDRVLFGFDQDYIDDPRRDVLSLSFKDQYGELITDIRPTQTRVMPFFANLLPEGPMRAYLARRAGVNAAREFFLLWALGQDLPGAVTVRPATGETLPQDAPVTVEEARGRRRPDDRGRPLRFSLPGVQLKFSALAEASGGLTIPVDGVGGSWIVKLPSATFDAVPENEYAMMSLAKRIGIDTPEIRLVPVDDIAGLPEGIAGLGKTAFAIRRFDRPRAGEAIHVEDFAQVFGIYPERKYERASYKNIAEVLWAEAGETAVAEFVRRLVFSTLIGNADLHLKNWSLIYPDRRQAALAPAYDYVSTIAYIDDNGMALNYARTRRFDALTEDELNYLAAKARLPGRLVLASAREAVDRFRQVWPAAKHGLGLVAASVDKIDKHLERIPLFSTSRSG